MKALWRSGNAAVCKTVIARVQFPSKPQMKNKVSLFMAIFVGEKTWG